MTWLMTQMWVELLIAAVFGGVVGWALHLLYAKRIAGAGVAKSAEGGATDPDGRTRIAELESQLNAEKAELDAIRRKAGIQKAGEEGPLAEGSLMWRNRHLESRVRFLEGKLADLESEAMPAQPVEDQNDEATRLRWRNSLSRRPREISRGRAGAHRRPHDWNAVPHRCRFAAGRPSSPRANSPNFWSRRAMAAPTTSS